jgi:hypothetical protein
VIKDGVDLRGLQPQMAVAYTIAAVVFWEQAGASCWITSGSDGKHGHTSLHYKGKALDLRTKHLRPEQVHPVWKALKAALGTQFDVVLESDHIHVEFDPKEVEKEEA